MYIDIYLFRLLPASFLGWTLAALAWTVGGWLIATHLFRLEKSERLFVGFSIGLIYYLFLVNVLAQIGLSDLAFLVAAPLVLVTGGLIAWTAERPVVDWGDLSHWKLPLAGVFLALVFARLNAGLSIFDDPHHLGTISLMARGDIPPHFFLNADRLFRYHYGFDLLAASLVRIGGLFPWSAYDVGKGLASSLGILVAYVLGRRYIRTDFGGYFLAALTLFAGGTRYLLLLLPPNVLERVDRVVELIGSSAASGEPLSRMLARPWLISGGPPVPFPFAFQNGVFRAGGVDYGGTGSLSLAILFLIVLLSGSVARKYAGFILTVILSIWALCSETGYGIFVIGMGLVWLYQVLRRRSFKGLPPMVWAIGISLPIVLLQGGTITQVAADILRGVSASSQAGVLTAASASGFGIRWPPAILSGHLGSLRLDSPLALLVAFIELGPVLLFVPWITVRVWKEQREDVTVLQALSLGALVSFIIPIFLTYASTYTSDRDMARFTGLALGLWTTLLGLLAVRHFAKAGNVFKTTLVASVGAMMFGGVVLTGVGMTALAEGTISEGLVTLDAQVSRETWGVIPNDGLIFDPASWRATVLTGLSTKANSHFDPVPGWDPLVEAPDVRALLAAGYNFVYLDPIWWDEMPAASKESLSQPCVELVSDQVDATGTFRRLIDLRACQD